MVKLNELIKQEAVFPDTEIIKADDILGENIEIKSFKVLEGEKGEFMHILIFRDEKPYTLQCGGSAIVDNLKKIAKILELKEDAKGVITFADFLETSILKKKSKETGMQYLVFE
jgi:hypothetical protein